MGRVCVVPCIKMTDVYFLYPSPADPVLDTMDNPSSSLILPLYTLISICEKALFFNKKVLDKMRRENVYPEVARQILKEHYIQTDAENKIIKPEAFNRLVEGKHPKPFDGEQEKPEPKKSSTDRLVEELERQVDSYE